MSTQGFIRNAMTSSACGLMVAFCNVKRKCGERKQHCCLNLVHYMPSEKERKFYSTLKSGIALCCRGSKLELLAEMSWARVVTHLK